VTERMMLPIEYSAADMTEVELVNMLGLQVKEPLIQLKKLLKLQRNTIM
jgi:hypothetical protein